jgi:spore germination cell wall hydrolase CwlJ-like protein
MHKIHDVMRRSDRMFVAALTLVFVTVSAAVGAAAGYRPHTDKNTTAAVVAGAALPVPAAPAAKPAMTAAEELLKARLLAEHRCLSEALYYEARGEGTVGQKAIAEVVFTRMRTGNYGQSICAVVYEGASAPHCQFSFTCDGELALAKQPKPWMRAQELAARILTGQERLNGSTGGATNFHAISVEPFWASELERTTQIGNHIFYRDPPRTREM